MDDGLVLEVLDINDITKVLALYEADHTNISEEYWRWLYAQTPDELVLIAKDSQTSSVVGFYAVITWPISFESITVQTAQSVHTIVHPNYRRRGIFVTLANECYKNAKSLGFPLLIGWTGETGAAIKGFVGRLGWHDLGKMPVLVLPIRAFRAVKWLGMSWIKRIVAGTYLSLRGIMKHPRKPKDEGYKFVQGSWDYEGFANCWKSAIGHTRVSVTKDSAFYKNRFTMSNRADEFIPFVIRTGNQIVAFAICLERSTQTGTEGVIAELQALEEHPNAFELLCWECVNYFKRRGVDYVRIWAKKPSWIMKSLDRMGFIDRKGNAHFIVRPLDETSSLLPRVLDFELWDLTLCDSDHV
jgi:GNAT superfamily N-acetyltransferase